LQEGVVFLRVEFERALQRLQNLLPAQAQHHHLVVGVRERLDEVVRREASLQAQPPIR
jgi:hypothetical protein